MSTSSTPAVSASTDLPAVLVTGAAGFVGFHVAKALLDEGRAVFGHDNLNDYYSVEPKRARLDQLTAYERFRFAAVDVADKDGLSAFAAAHPTPIVVHLAAQLGVRYSVEDPQA